MKEIEARLKLSAIDRTAKAFTSVSRNLDRIDAKSRQVARSQTAVGRAQQGIARASAGAEMALLRYAAPAALAYGAARTVTRFAAVERSIGRIGITANATAAETKAAFGVIDKAAFDYATTQDSVTAGLDSLVASGRDLPSALSFLPAVTATAQAAGAEITDIATTADALGNNFDIAGDRMQGAFDILVKAGKEGKFELKDMAQYVPSIAPAFEVLGYKGEAGVMKLAAALQIVRQRTGSAGEAATAFQNVLQKMETEETAKKFAKMGIDLREEMAKARAEGADLLEVFVKLATEAVDGDLSKLPLLFGDQQMLVGVRALIQGGDDLTAMVGRLGNAAGETRADLDRLLGDTQSKIDRMGSSWDRLLKNVGGGVATVANPAMDQLNTRMEAGQAYESGLAKYQAEGGSKGEARAEFDRRYRQVNRDYSWYNPSDRQDRSKAFVDAMAAYGRGNAATPFAELDRVSSGRRTQRFPSAADGLLAAEAARQRKLGNIDGGTVSRGEPVPRRRPEAATARAMPLAEQHASYGSGRVKGEAQGRAVMASDANLTASIDRMVSVQERIAAAMEGRALPPAMDASSSKPAFDTARFGDGPLAVEGIDELRQAMEGGSQAIARGGRDVGAAFGESAGATLGGQATSAGNAFGLSAARTFNANVRVPSAPSGGNAGSAPSGRNLGTTMPEAGQ